MRYLEPRPETREQAEADLASDVADRAAQALISVALYEQDRRWAEVFCLKGLRDRRDEVASAAVTALGHIARIHRAVSPGIVEALLEIRRNAAVTGLVEDTLDDILIFVGGG